MIIIIHIIITLTLFELLGSTHSLLTTKTHHVHNRLSVDTAETMG